MPKIGPIVVVELAKQPQAKGAVFFETVAVTNKFVPFNLPTVANCQGTGLQICCCVTASPKQAASATSKFKGRSSSAKCRQIDLNSRNRPITTTSVLLPGRKKKRSAYQGAEASGSSRVQEPTTMRSTLVARCWLGSRPTTCCCCFTVIAAIGDCYRNTHQCC